MTDLLTRRPMARAVAQPAQDGSRMSRGAVVLLALSSATVVAEMSSLLGPARGVLVLAFWLLVPGGVLRSLLRPGRRVRMSAVDPAVGLAVLCLLSQGTLALGLVPAKPATVVVALLCAVLATVRLATERETAPRALPPRMGSPEILLGALLVSALILWAASWGHVSAGQLGPWGLLPALPVTWYASFAVLLGCAVVLAVSATLGRTRSVLWAVAIALLVVVIHATPAIVEGAPRYTWTFKHLGVVRYLIRFHEAPRSADIYFNWPGFFSAAAWIHQTTGWSLAALARWAPPFFELLSVLGVLTLSRALFRDARVVRLSVVIYVVANWVGQDYFSPQAFAFFLGLFFLASFIGLLKTAQPSPERRVLAATAALTWAAVLTSHQLTPVMLLVASALCCFVLRRWPWRSLALMAGTEVAWVALAVPYLRHAKYPLFNFDPLAGSQQPVQAATVRSVGYLVRSDAVHVLYYGLFLVAAVVLARGLYQGARERRDPRSSPAFLAAVLGFGPTFVLLAQNYGGEGELRAYLFAVPFLAAVTASAVVSARGRMKAVARGVGIAVVSAAFLLAYYGQEQVNVVESADVAAASWFYAHAPADAAPMFIAPNAPSRVSSRYAEFPVAADALPTLLDSARFARTLSADAATEFMDSLGQREYLIATPSEGRYLSYFGIMNEKKYAELLRSLNHNSRLQLVYAQDGAYVWKLT